MSNSENFERLTVDQQNVSKMINLFKYTNYIDLC